MPRSFPFHSAAVAAILLAVGLPSRGAGSLTLAEAIATALGRSQQIVAQDAAATAAREQAVAAGQLPDPVLKLGIDNLPVSGEDRFSLTRDFMTMRRIGIAQDIPRAEKRQLRAERFEQDAYRAQAERQMAVAAVQRDTAIAWLDRYYVQAMRDLVQRQMDEARLQLQAAEIAFGNARGSQADVFAARTALTLLEDRLSQVERQFRSAGLMLARWIGSAADIPPAGPPPWQSTPLENLLTTEHIKHHPDMQVLAAQLEAARTELKLAQANKKADWSVEATYSQRGPAFSNMLSFGVSIPLQLDQKNRQDREAAAKQALVGEAQARFEDMLRSHEAEVRGLLNDWQNGKERVARFNGQLIPTAQQRSLAALTSYRSGKGDLATVLAARRDEIDVRMQALALEQDTARLWAQLNFLIPDMNTAAAAGSTHE